MNEELEMLQGRIKIAQDYEMTYEEAKLYLEIESSEIGEAINAFIKLWNSISSRDGSKRIISELEGSNDIFAQIGQALFEGTFDI